MHQLAAALLLHDGKDSLGQEEHCLQVDVHHAIPAGVGDLLNGSGAGDAGHVHQNVDAAVNAAGSLHLLGNVVKISHVELQSGSLAALALDVSRNSLSRRQIQVSQNNLGAVLGQLAGTGLTNAAAAAGHDGNFIC